MVVVVVVEVIGNTTADLYFSPDVSLTYSYDSIYFSTSRSCCFISSISYFWSLLAFSRYMVFEMVADSMILLLDFLALSLVGA